MDSGIGSIGRTLIGVGLAIVALGALMLLLARFTGGRGLPGDFSFGRGNLRVYFPLATMIILSAVLTLVLNLLARWRR